MCFFAKKEEMNMKDWKHLTLEQRKVISNGISHNYKLKEIAESLGFDPTSISKEVKRNREAITIGKDVSNCKKVNRWPYVCGYCQLPCNKLHGLYQVLKAHLMSKLIPLF